MNECRRFLLLLAFMMGSLTSLASGTAFGENLNIFGEVVFSDGESARYRVASNGFLVVSDGVTATYFLQHKQDGDDSVFVQGFAERVGSHGFLQLPISRIDTETAVAGFEYGSRRGKRFFEIRIIDLESRAHDSAPQFEMDSASSICCVSCNGRNVCSAEVSTSCGSCGVENLL
jgi:hypothetical protein